MAKVPHHDGRWKHRSMALLSSLHVRMPNSDST